MQVSLSHESCLSCYACLDSQGVVVTTTRKDTGDDNAGWGMDLRFQCDSAVLASTRWTGDLTAVSAAETNTTTILSALTGHTNIAPSVQGSTCTSWCPPGTLDHTCHYCEGSFDNIYEAVSYTHLTLPTKA